MSKRRVDLDDIDSRDDCVLRYHVIRACEAYLEEVELIEDTEETESIIEHEEIINHLSIE